MSAKTLAQKTSWLGGWALCIVSVLCGCAKKDAPSRAVIDGCQGRSESCLSLTLRSEENIDHIDRLEIMIKRATAPASPMTPLDKPVALPVNVAVLWPDGPGTISVRTYLQAQMNGVSPEMALDLRNGQHELHELMLFPPLGGN